MPPAGANKRAEQISASQAARIVKSGDWVDYGATLSQPDVFDKALAARKLELRQVKFRSCISVKPRAVLEADADGDHFFWFSWHFSGYDRKKHDAKISHYLPVNLGEVPDYYRRFIETVDVAVLKTCPMDADGNFNFSATGLWHRAIIERAKTVIVEVTTGLPYCYGENNAVHRSEVDFVINGDNEPAAQLPSTPLREADRAVGRLIAGEIEDGACLQVGIGAMPNAVCATLLESGVKNLGIHSEMLTDGMIDLYTSGQATGSSKQVNKDKHVYSFALGSSALYEAIDRNRDFLCCQVDSTNPPHIIMRNDRTVAINNTTQIDLQGQAASESDGHRHISGTGGQLQFVRGAYASPGGKSFICLASTYERGGVRKSLIVLDLTPGNIVTTPRSDMMYVVTEYGIVNLKGQSVAERAKALISIAHPDYRESLEREAREHGLIPRGYF
ncbi:MAG: acyl-CoA hydrolase [Gammaproteobacteria bacterium]|jgi:acyl-CoA hydrolase